MSAHPLRLDFDDIIYRLQSFGGASEYWRELTTRVVARGHFDVRHRRGTKFTRALPIPTSARIFHSSHFRVGRGPRVRNVATVHDLIYEFGYAGVGAGARFNLIERRKCYFAADALVCVSNSTRDDLLKVYPALASRHIEVIPHGLPDALVECARNQRVRNTPMQQRRPYLLYVGGRQSYKGFAVALEGFSRSGRHREGFDLLCTGSPFNPEELKAIDQWGLRTHVKSCGRVDRAALYLLYEGATALVYTSTYEGFGLPVIEAMALGCQVIACDVSSIPEVAGDCAILVPPGDPEAIARAILDIDSASTKDRINRGYAQAMRFSWDRSAESHEQIYSLVAEG